MFEQPRDTRSRPGLTENPVLFGRYGLRAGWSIALAIFFYYLLAMVLTPLCLSVTGTMQQAIAQNEAMSHAQVTQQPMSTGPKLLAASEAALLAAVAISTLVMACLEGRKLHSYGLGRRRMMDLTAGAFWGLTGLSLLVLCLHATHLLVFDTRMLHGSAMYLYGIKWMFAFLLLGLFEEYSTRGFLQYTLMRGVYGVAKRVAPMHGRAVAFWFAAIMMSSVFAYLHLGNPGETALGIVMVFVAGLLFSYALWRTGSLWWAVGFHMTWDWAQSFLYGVPDSGDLSVGRLYLTHATGNRLLSGGADGPEGSVLVLPTLLLMALVVRFTTRAGSQPAIESEHMAETD